MNEDKVILIIEDEKPLSEAIKIKLENENISVVVARTADQAIDYLDELQQIDAVWLDHYLIGGKSGFDVLLEIKKDDSKWKSIPVFLISNTASEDKIEKYISFGVDKYYIKSSATLKSIIDDVVGSLSK